MLCPADDDCDSLLRSVRFVCTFATSMGVVGRALRAAAAAAAAALREAVLDERRKAEAAAVAAAGFAVEALRGCSWRKRGKLA